MKGCAMKARLLLIIIALSFCLQNCLPENDSSSGVDCKDGNCTPADSETDGDIDAEDLLSERGQEEEISPDLCAAKLCPLPGQCEKEIICNPSSGECEIVFSDEGDSCDDGIACNGKDTCDGSGNCTAGLPPLCNDNKTCTEPEGLCDCLKPFRWSGDKCIPMSCKLDADCDDELACNGAEFCGIDELCKLGEAVECDSTRQCSEPNGDCLCRDEYYDSESECVLKPPCPLPNAPVMATIHQGAEIEFTAPQDYEIQMSAIDGNSFAPEAWSDENVYSFDRSGAVNIYARTVSNYCISERIFSFRYNVAESYQPAAGQDGSTAIHMNSEVFKAWASDYMEPVDYGSELIDTWKTPEKALGPAKGTTSDVVSLGRGGSITLTFNRSIKNGPSYDFAVFENGFNDKYLELAYVEVSSDGEHFLRFDCAYLGTEAVGAFAFHDTSLIGGLAGKYRAGYGTPFDLEELINENAAVDGEVDINDIRFVRIVDVVGDGNAVDSFGNPIYDPYPTVESAGFDLDAIGVINN